MARHDVLTDLPNRQLFDDRLQTSLAIARRNKGRLALLYIDLDKFKQVNDTLGHLVGDLLLIEVAQRITSCLRESDTVGRMGGDEFMVLLNDILSTEDASVVAEKIRAALNRPFDLAGQKLQIASSIGIATYPEDGEEKQHLIRHADEAMYGAKTNGGNQLLTAALPALRSAATR
jgi:diguanylate cyclase (GGDEF)-like protein